MYIKTKKLIKDNKLDILKSTHVSGTQTTDELFIKLDDIPNIKLTKAKLTKMKLEELNNLSKQFNITITKQNPTKAFLIELILAKISNENT